MRALIVKDPWATDIVKGYKTIENRTRPTNIKERIGIIKSGSKTVIGEVDLVDCKVDGNTNHFGRWIYAWILKNPLEYKQPKPYNHPRGAQIWVRL